MKYNVGDIITGVISGVKSYGIFIKLDDSFITFCHISNLSYKFISNIFDKYKIGQEVTGQVIKVLDDKVEVSLKALKDKSEPLPDKQKPSKKCNNQDRNINTKKDKNESFEDMLKDYLKSSNTQLNSIAYRNKRKNKR